MSAKDRIRVPLAFGPGLDRATGPMVVEPGAMEDLRNFYLLDDKLQVRKGFGIAGALAAAGVPEVTHVLAGHPLRSEAVGIVVGWASATGGVHVFRTDPDGSVSGHLGLWFTWNGEIAPIIHMCENFGRIFMAHDEPRILQRAATFVYDPLSVGDPLLSPLVDTFSSAESITQYIRFRGVVTHLDYLFGWGYGTAELDRPEMVRASLPGQPRVFEANHYWIIGDRRDPVLQCVPGAADLIVFKAGEWHAITGYDHRTFGQVRRDPLFGLLAPRLAVNVSGEVFFWSPDGPRVTDGTGPSQSLEVPLDLQGFEPADLPPEGDPCEAFATYVWGDRIVLFVFGRRSYALTVRVRGDWKWSYWTFPWSPFCAFTLWDTTFTRATPPVGYPIAVSEDVYGTYVDLHIQNVNQDGDERVEVWMVQDGGEWALRLSTDVQTTETQVLRVPGLEVGEHYNYSLRYRRGNQIHPSYQGDPSTWPAISQGDFTTVLDPPLVGLMVAAFAQVFASTGPTHFVWERTSASSHYLQFLITPSVETGPEQEIRLFRKVGEAGTWTFLDQLTGGVDFDFDTPFLYQDVDPPQGEPLFYRGNTVADIDESPPSAELRLWAGPEPEAAKASGSVPFSVTTLIAADRMSYDHRVTAHRLHEELGFWTAVRFYDNRNDSLIPLGYNETPDQFRGEESYDLPAEPLDQQPPDFGKTDTLVRITHEFENTLPENTIIQIGVVFQAIRFTVTDVSEMFTVFVGV